MKTVEVLVGGELKQFPAVYEINEGPNACPYYVLTPVDASGKYEFMQSVDGKWRGFQVCA